MLKYISLSLFLFCSLTLNSQNEIRKNFLSADSIVLLMNNKYPQTYNFSEVYSAKKYLRGHWVKPNLIDSADLEVNISSINGIFSLRESLLHKGDSLKSIFTYSEKSDSSFFQAFRKEELSPLKEPNIKYYFSPQNILKDLNRYKSSLHIVCSDNHQNNILGFNDISGSKFFVYVDKQNFEINELYKVYVDLTDGDMYESIKFQNYLNSGNLISPSKITHSLNYKTQEILELNTINYTSVDSLYRQRKVNLQLDTLVNNIYMVKFLDNDNKTIVLENENHLSIFEAPINAISSTQLINFLEDKFPNKPIKYCYLTHHHPDHAGGLKAFSNINCEIIAPEEEVEYLQSIIDSPYNMSSIYNSGTTPTFTTLSQKEKRIFKDGIFDIQAYEIGKTTKHADNFIAYYIPRNNILFSSDLFFIPEKEIWQQGQRAYSMYEIIQSENIRKDSLKIVPSFPLHGFKDFGTCNDLTESLKEAFPSIK